MKYKKNKNNRILLKQDYKKVIFNFTYLFFLLLLVSVAISIKCIKKAKISEINEAILSVDQISNDKDRIVEIMRLDNLINSYSKKEQQSIYTNKLLSETSMTTNNLKKSVKWNEYLNKKETFFSLDSIISTEMIKSFTISRGIINPTKFYMPGKADLERIISYLSLPYIDCLNDAESLYEKYKAELSGEYYDYCLIDFSESNASNNTIKVSVYGSGYVLIKKLTEEKTISNLYISLIPLDYSDFRSAYGAYEQDESFYLSDKINPLDIEYIDICDYTSDLTSINGYSISDQKEIYDFYDNYLKSLHFSNDYMEVRKILMSFGRKLKSITIKIRDINNFTRFNLVAIHIDPETNECVLAHGIMEYACDNSLE